MAELINENKIGVTKGTGVESIIDGQFRGETSEVGLYLAMARQAQREGFPEIAEVLKTIAMEEAEHAAHFAELNGKISTCTKENLEKMLAGEIGANKVKREGALKAKEENIDHAHDYLDESSRDEGRHANMLEGMLKLFWCLIPSLSSIERKGMNEAWSFCSPGFIHFRNIVAKPPFHRVPDYPKGNRELPCNELVPLGAGTCCTGQSYPPDQSAG